MATVRRNGMELKFGTSAKRRDPQIAFGAVKQTVLSWRFVARDLFKNHKMQGSFLFFEPLFVPVATDASFVPA